MPNVLLKNEVGEDIAYNDVDTVTLRRVEGGTATYTFQRPNATDAWKMIQQFITGDGRTSLISKSQLTVPNGKIISSSEPGFGTWYQSRYDAWRISTLNINQMYAVPNGAILANSGSNSAIYFWDDTTQELKVLSSNAGNIYNFRAYGEKYFLATYRYWLIYDPETQQVTELLTGNSGMNAYCFEDDDGLFLSVANNGGNNPKGIYILDPETFELTQIFDQGWYWLGNFRTVKGLNQSASYILEVEDGYLFGGYNGGSQCYGILHYERDTKTVTRLFDNGYYWFNDSVQSRYNYSTYTRYMPGYGVVFCNAQSYSWGTWYYDYATKTLTRIVENAAFMNWIETEDVFFGSYSSYGVIIFDKTTKTWYRPVTTGLYETVIKCENGYLLGPQSYSYGFKYYEIETGEVTTIATTLNYWRYGLSVEGGALLSCETGNGGVWSFNEETKELTQLSTQGYAWYMVRWHDAILMGSFGSAYGWHYYKDGVLTYHALTGSYDRYLHAIVPVDDGWLIGSWSYNSTIHFVDGETGEATALGISANQIGPYMPYWYGNGGIWKPTYDYNRKYGRYRIISSYDGYGFIFDDITHELVPMTYWYDGNPTPSTGSVAKSVYMRRVSFVEYAQNRVMILPCSSSNNGTIIFNYASGEAFIFNNSALYVNNEYLYWFLPYTTLVPVTDGYLIFIKPFDWEKYPSTFTSAQGVWHLDTTTNRLRRLITTGYYDSTEEAPGGLYIYLSSLPQIERLYWNAESKTLTRVDY